MKEIRSILLDGYGWSSPVLIVYHMDEWPTSFEAVCDLIDPHLEAAECYPGGWDAAKVAGEFMNDVSEHINSEFLKSIFVVDVRQKVN